MSRTSKALHEFQHVDASLLRRWERHYSDEADEASRRADVHEQKAQNARNAEDNASRALHAVQGELRRRSQLGKDA